MENQITAATDAPERQVSAVLREASRRLISAGIASGALDAEVLLGHVLSAGREQMVLAANTTLTHTDLRAYERLLARRLKREPAAYITGKREFWSLEFHVTPDVLIPRPETETLVEVALKSARDFGSAEPLRIIDLGTGSGAIAVALAAELANAEIWATDVSAAALSVARDNARRNHVADKIQFVAGDLLGEINRAEPFHLIVSNPPYISSADIDALEPEVSHWEPRAALDGGPDGLDYYRRIAAQAFHYLAPSSVLAVEIGAGMGEAVAALFKQAADCYDVTVQKDYAGKQRVVVARKIVAR
jgi:release factor glutamine methyltransferase